MQPHEKPVRRWPWYVAIGALTVSATLALQSVVIGITATRPCGELELVSQSAAMACKLQVWADPAEWLNWWLALIAAGVTTGVGFSLRKAAFQSQRGLTGVPRDAYSVRTEYEKIVMGLIGITLAALFLNLPNLISGRVV